MNAYQWFLLGMMVDREAMRVSVCGDVMGGLERVKGIEPSS
jgi:hypothetical protein